MPLAVQILRDNNKKRNCKCICIAAYKHTQNHHHHSTLHNKYDTQFTRAQRKSTIKRKEIEGKVVENWMLRFYYSSIHTGTR